MKSSLAAFFIFSLAAIAIKLISSFREGGWGELAYLGFGNDEVSGGTKWNPL
ncbi:hypothetical protein PITCH_A1280068 [uncultured Desulfobacterium sp.]|uniref:Uncharacterized protein n=1 Tax=uncultured Desulfobacterium sp. TaxID=201089 RepID=A0A445MSB7_9BACT|nr:hypothetical protein PITCH_A1280068 [uncultured Desulfobacterium sp.]